MNGVNLGHVNSRQISSEADGDPGWLVFREALEVRRHVASERYQEG